MNIEILQPRPFDLVGSTILVAGNAVAFEGTLSISVSEGHDEYHGFASVGATSIRPFQGSIEIPAVNAFKLDRLFVTFSDDTGGEEGSMPARVTIPVLFGPRIMPGFGGYWLHTVVPGDTLTAISRHYFDGDASKVSVIQRANQHIVTDPNLIFVGQLLRIPREL